MKLKMLYGDWENHYAHIYWAYLSDTFEKGVISHRVFSPISRIDYTDNKHSDYIPSLEYPIEACEKWCKEKSHEIVERKKLEDE